MSRTLLAACLSTALFLAACGGMDDTTATTPAPTDAATQADGDAADGEIVRCPAFDADCVEVLPPNTVELRAIDFKPGELTVAAGTTVTFENFDAGVEHTATAGTPDDPDPDTLNLEFQDAGDVETFTFDQAGTFAYYCVIHPQMRGTIIVE
jgi:plastocyanin